MQVLESDIKTYGKVLRDLGKQAEQIETMDEKQGKEVFAKQVITGARKSSLKTGDFDKNAASS